ncbi:MAG: sigma 54-interacting transcriptional regulator [Negativicutes bacterium]|nr:sigma 54-interacting transcriptional regulator [Negativicutes bacterium]
MAISNNGVGVMKVKISAIVEKIPSFPRTGTTSQAISAMMATGSGLLPVVDENAVYCGAITSDGLLRRNQEAGADQAISDIIDSSVSTIAVDACLEDIPAQAGRFVVLDADSHVVGIITPARLITGLLSRLKAGGKDAKKFGPGLNAIYLPDNIAEGLNTELEAIINSSYDGIFVTDGTGVVLRINKAYERITGVKASEVLGKRMDDLVSEGYYDQSVTVLVRESRRVMTIDQTVKNNKHILVTGNPIFDEAGGIFRVVTNVRDVTDLNNLQQQLSKKAEETLKYKTELSHLRSLHLKEADIIYRSTVMASVVELAVKVADVSSTVLITGESGTGKELIAKLIHRHGKGDTKPFIKINCGAIPDTLLESELFGYEGGAFTGARKLGKPGLFELANNGTLFLDEIGEMPPVLQVKLLRAIQDKAVTRLGGVQAKTINVRIIAATHRTLLKMVEQGTFREDLYYRLMVVPIHMPPLRERKEDIPLLSMHFLEKFNREFGFCKTVSSQVIDKFVEYSWPGNVRQLENVIERMIVTTQGNEILVSSLPKPMLQSSILPKSGTKLKVALAAVEKYLLEETLREYGSLNKVAEVLGVDRTTVFRKAVKYKLKDQK